MFFKNNRLGIIWSLVVIVVCLIPGSNLPSTSFLDGFGIDKIIHASLYFILIILVAKGLFKQVNSSFSRNKLLIAGFLYCVFLGVGIEFVQSVYVAGRNGDVFDVLANALGTLIGVLIVVKYEKGIARNN